MNDKIKNHKNFDKIAKKTNKKSKEEGPNWKKILLLLKKIINLIWKIKLKTIKTLTKEPRKKKLRNQK